MYVNKYKANKGIVVVIVDSSVKCDATHFDCKDD